jgi:hypothetical protein
VQSAQLRRNRVKIENIRSFRFCLVIESLKIDRSFIKKIHFCPFWEKIAKYGPLNVFLFYNSQEDLWIAPTLGHCGRIRVNIRNRCVSNQNTVIALHIDSVTTIASANFLDFYVFCCPWKIVNSEIAIKFLRCYHYSIGKQ